MKRKKLTIAEQIQDMHTKGISFNYNNEKEVSDFFSHNNYYFKLKSYGKNYDKYHATEKKGKYINLDFAYLQELNSLKAPYHIKIHKTKEIQFEISKIKTISQNSREKWMNNPVIHDFIILVFVFLKLIKSDGIKQARINELKHLFNERMPRHKEYFFKNDSIIESYKFIAKIINYFCNKFRK